jgi:hypothetical protein
MSTMNAKDVDDLITAYESQETPDFRAWGTVALLSIARQLAILNDVQIRKLKLRMLELGLEEQEQPGEQTVPAWASFE